MVRSSNAPPSREGPRVNTEIKVRAVRLVGADGEMIGVVPLIEALRAAQESGLDLVEISPNADPPVCKLLDYGKYRYELQKKKAEARKNQKVVDIKEIKVRPGIDDHDFEIKMKQMKRFLEDGDRVKVTLRFRGRELSHVELGAKVLERIRTELEPLSKVETFPRLEGKQMVMMLAPKA